jgi:hypothetical protein
MHPSGLMQHKSPHQFISFELLSLQFKIHCAIRAQQWNDIESRPLYLPIEKCLAVSSKLDLENIAQSSFC